MSILINYRIHTQHTFVFVPVLFFVCCCDEVLVLLLIGFSHSKKVFLFFWKFFFKSTVYGWMARFQRPTQPECSCDTLDFLIKIIYHCLYFYNQSRSSLKQHMWLKSCCECLVLCRNVHSSHCSLNFISCVKHIIIQQCLSKGVWVVSQCLCRGLVYVCRTAAHEV